MTPSAVQSASARSAPVGAGTAPGQCFHCGLPLNPQEPVSARIDGDERSFCCTGCKAVCEAIYAAGLEGFYRRTPAGEVFGPPPEPPKQLGVYDLDEVQAEYVDTTADLREINLHVEGIHCAACVWLIEAGLAQMPGVAEARVNLTGRRLRLKWDNTQQRLSRLLGRLSEIGYAAVPFDPEAAEGALKRRNRDLLYRMAFAGFAAMNLMWISIALYAGADEGEFRGLFHWIGLLIATPTLLYSGWPFFRGALIGLKQRALTMDLPIAIGASITYLYSLYATFSGQGHVYWDTVVNFLFVILVGRFLEAISKRQAVASTQRLLDLQPKIATLLRDGEPVVVPIRAVKPDETLLVRPGETIPADGLVTKGRSEVDEAMLTGESAPVTRSVGDAVAAGTLNGAGVLEVRVTGLLRETALGRIIRLVEEAQSSKAPIQSLADRIVPWFVALTIGLGLLAFGLWVGRDLETALMAATSVLIITCPCAFGLATPMAIAVASGLGARHGILIKHGAVLETLSRIKHLVFDKTGTLTHGRPEIRRLLVMPRSTRTSSTLTSTPALGLRSAPAASPRSGSDPKAEAAPAGVQPVRSAHEALITGQGSVNADQGSDQACAVAAPSGREADCWEPSCWEAGQGVDALTEEQRDLLRLVAALERVSEHPVARAVLRLAEAARVPVSGLEVTEVSVAPGAGISGWVDGHRLLIGTEQWLSASGIQMAAPLATAISEGSDPAEPEGTQLHCAIDGVERLRLVAADLLREDAVEVVQALHRDGLWVTLLSGDREAVAQRVGHRLGVDDIVAEVRPDEKSRVVASLQAQGAPVAMVGDGINDAPALVQADVGIAVGSGTDVSIASADLVLMSSELMRVQDAMALSRRTLGTIRQNIALSMAYNLVMVPLAMAAMITPLVAAIAMPLSSLAVIGNSARLRRLFKS